MSDLVLDIKKLSVLEKVTAYLGKQIYVNTRQLVWFYNEGVTSDSLKVQRISQLWG